MKISYILNKILFLLFFLVLTGIQLQTEIVRAQDANRKITGVVVDETATPLAGATVLMEGTSLATVTDAEGKFELLIPAGVTAGNIVIKFVGYLSENIDITNKASIEVALVPDLQQVDEVVVVAIGYGNMRKADLTGAITSVSSDDMKKGVISSSEQLLQGKVAGLTVIQGTGDPASGASLRLRGGTSLTASNSPLIVVDGIPGVDINSVQPSEIVTIDVLKDASAAAIYGSRGANGVIIVTTNRENKGGTVEYSSYIAIGRVANHLDLLSADQWRGYVRDSMVLGAVDYGANTDWQKELEQTAVTQSHTISFSNGNELGGYRASINYLDNQGVIKKSQLERVGISLSSYRYTLNKKLKIDMGFHGNIDKWNPLDNRIFERSYNLGPTVPVDNPDGSFTSISGTSYENPVEINTHRQNDDARQRMLGYGKAEWEIFKGFKATLNLSYEHNSMKADLYKPTNAVMEGIQDKGYGQKTLGEYNNIQLESYFTYARLLAEKHSINLLAGYSYLENVYSGFGAQRRGFDTDLFSYNNLGSGQNFRADDVYSYKGSARLISFFTRANYSYLSKYMITATLRRDGSTRFGKNNKWGLFPSASAAWRLSDEAFMDWSADWLTNLKLRMGYGVTGNQDGIGEYKSLSILGSGTDSYYDAISRTWKQSYYVSQNANPDLKWESTAQFNIGLDFSFLNRVNGTLDFYQKNTSDLLYTYSVPQPPYLYGTMLANVGELSNKGVELTLSSMVMKRGDFTWDLNLTLAHNKQIIEKLSTASFVADTIPSGPLHNLRGMSDQYAEAIITGHAVGTFWGPEFGSLSEDGRFLDPDSNRIHPVIGKYADTLKKDLGNVQPKLSFGLSTVLTYKRFNLEISLYGMLGQKVLNATAMSMSDPTRLPTQNVADAYLTSGIMDEPTFSSYWIEDASFLRLQTVTLGYNFELRKIGIERLRIYLSGENLFVLTGYTGIDPEVSIDGLTSPGIDMFNYYPKPRTYSLGLNVTF
jgi:TonB-dependent starch-binding outer membrane protein SusC